MSSFGVRATGAARLRRVRGASSASRRAGTARPGTCRAAASAFEDAAAFDMPFAPIELPEGPWVAVEGGVAAPAGFSASAAAASLRSTPGRADLAAVVSDRPAAAAGVFTQNRVAAAPVLFCRAALAASPTARCVLVNAGQANAATGEQGAADTLASVEAAAAELSLEPADVLVESTGVIGRRIKMKELLAALPALAAALEPSAAAGNAAATAITTTDLVRKTCALELELGGTTVRVGGMAKGSGMIHPNMATMLGVVTCDAAVEPALWRALVKRAAEATFNQISVDGDTSTNDTVLALANGAAGGDLIENPDSQEAKLLEQAVYACCEGLAKSIASDGEGATCLIEVAVTGAPDQASAATIARSIASSSLTKAAIYGGDPNWGRIACAAGYAGVDFEQTDLDITLGDTQLMKAGQPLAFDEAAAAAYLKSRTAVHGTVAIDVSVGDGEGASKAWGCDLTYDYVKINAEYTT